MNSAKQAEAGAGFDAIALAWPQSMMGDGLRSVAKRIHGVAARHHIPNPGADFENAQSVQWERWMRAACARLQMQSAAPDLRAGDMDALPTEDGERAVIFALPTQTQGDESRFVIILRTVRARNEVVLLVPAAGASDVTDLGREATVRLDQIESVLLGWSLQDDGAHLVDGLGVSAEKARALRRGLARGEGLRAILQGRARPNGWICGRASSSFWERFAQAGGRRLLSWMVLGIALEQALTIGAFALMGEAAMSGRFEGSWMWAFGMVMVTTLVVHGLTALAIGDLGSTMAGLARERLLEGILRLNGQQLRATGVGQLLGRVLEVDALEGLTRGGALWLVVGIEALLFCAGILVFAAGIFWHLALLVGWCVVVFVLLRRFRVLLVQWADARFELTHDLVERMVGHRTLVVQGRRGQGDAESEAALQGYEKITARLDASLALVETVVPRGWLAVGLVGLMPLFALGRAYSGVLAIAVGGVTMGFLGFMRFVEVLPDVAAAHIAWARIKPLFAAASEVVQEAQADLLATAPDEAATGNRGLLVARNIHFSYPGRAESVLRGVDVNIKRGERVLLSGRSGRGKSTLAGVLCGLHAPDAGVLLLGGFDHHSVGGARWRQRVAAVPQFHQNHMLSASLLFNLLLSRRWPPQPEDVAEAETLCDELGLGPLIKRMPAGLEQMVGDSGWQLSHGERGRVFLARALLQQADVRILDESFAALDPETFEQALAVVKARAETLVVIAHR